MGVVSDREARRHLSRAPVMQRFGDFLQQRQDIIRCVQWCFVVIYLFLLLAPVFVPQAANGGQLFAHLALFAEAVFWGLWWPGVILATLLFGQFWCGLLCPDGAMTELISRHGRAGKIPHNLRWPGWPLLAFSIITLAVHLFDARHSPVATLAVLGGGSFAAWATGYYLGRGKRIWCRYLCPVSSLFSLLARSAMLCFRVDRAAWNAAPRPLPRPVDCPQLLDVARLRSNEKCNMCARCSSHRNAVVLALRFPGQEIAVLREDEANLRDAFAICFVLIGLYFGVACGPAAFPGSGLLPRAASIILNALALGASVAALLWLGAAGRIRRAVLLAYGLIPLAGMGLLMGALGYAKDILEQSAAGAVAWVPMLQLALLLAGAAWSAVIGLIMARNLDAGPIGRAAAALAHILAVTLVTGCYLLAPLT